MTIRIVRENFLQTLESLSPGLSPRDLLLQSSCFVFEGETIITFNDEIACRNASPLPSVKGAVKAKPLLDLLSRLPDEQLGITVEDGQFVVKGKHKRGTIRMEHEILLPTESIDLPDGSDWRPLPEDFSEAITLVSACSSRDESEFVLTCVNITPDYMEATDRYQMARYPLSIPIDEESVLVRANSIAKVANLGMVDICCTASWVHFRNPAGLILSCRKNIDNYPSLDKYLKYTPTTMMVFPGGLVETVKRIEIFSTENTRGNVVLCEFKAGRTYLTGEGVNGKYTEMKQTAYDGDDVAFNIAPKLLLEISSKANQFCVSDTRLCIDTGKFKFLAATALPDKPKTEEPAGSESPTD